jgi:hypothetical protein
VRTKCGQNFYRFVRAKTKERQGFSRFADKTDKKILPLFFSSFCKKKMNKKKCPVLSADDVFFNNFKLIGADKTFFFCPQKNVST